MTLEAEGQIPSLITDEERAAKIAELDKAEQDFLARYYATCEAMGEKPDFTFLFENFGIGARDAYTDEDLDLMIAEDRRKAKESARTE